LRRKAEREMVQREMGVESADTDDTDNDRGAVRDLDIEREVGRDIGIGGDTTMVASGGNEAETGDQEEAEVQTSASMDGTIGGMTVI